MTTAQATALYNLITTVMMHSGRITPNKGAYWRKVPNFLNISESDMSSAMSLDVNNCLRIVATELSDNDKTKAFAMIINMAFADGTAQQNVCDLVQKIAYNMRFPEVLQRVGNETFARYQKTYAL